MVAWRTSYWSKMGDVVWGEVMVVVACVVSCCHATVPLYVVSTSLRTWDEARTICESHGNYLLAMPMTSDQVSAFKKVLTQRNGRLSGPVWLGLYRKQNSGPFYWVDGTGLDPQSKLAIDWYPGQPDNSGGNGGVVVRQVGGDDWGLDDRPGGRTQDQKQWTCQTPDDDPPSMSVTAELVDAGGEVNLTCIQNRPIQYTFRKQTFYYTYRKYGSADIHDTGLSYDTNDTYSLTSMNVSDTGMYWCTVGTTQNLDTHDPHDPNIFNIYQYFTLATSNRIYLRVTPKTPIFSLDPPVPVTGVYDGTQVTFQCASDSAIGVDIVPTYHFIRDGIGIKSTNLTFTKNITTSDIGNYACKVTMNGVDSAVSNSIAVKVFATLDEPIPTTTATPATTKTPGLSPEMKVLAGIQLAGFFAALFGLLGMCVPLAFVCLRSACCKRDKEEKEEDEDNDDDEDNDEQCSDQDEEHTRKVHWESEEDEETTESTLSSIKSHAENAVNASVWSGMSGGMPALNVPGVMPGILKRGPGVDLTNVDEEARSPDTTAPTSRSTSESPRGSVISWLFGSELFVPRLSGSASPNEASRK